MNITFLELGSAWLFISLVLPIYLHYQPELNFWPENLDWLYLSVLAFLCTTFAYLLALRALKYISAFASNLTINLEPVYRITLAWLILQENEELTAGFYWGGLLIIAVVFAYPLLKKRSNG